MSGSKVFCPDSGIFNPGSKIFGPYCPWAVRFLTDLSQPGKRGSGVDPFNQLYSVVHLEKLYLFAGRLYHPHKNLKNDRIP